MIVDIIITIYIYIKGWMMEKEQEQKMIKGRKDVYPPFEYDDARELMVNRADYFQTH
jgi:hypothetical protein